VPTIVILVLTALAVGATGYLCILPLSLESGALWLACVVLLAYTLIAEKHDAVILNGALLSLYLAFLTF